MKIKCPRCKSQLEVDAIGDFVSCSSCSVEFHVEESQKTKSLIENFHPFAESEPYIPPVTANQNVSKPSSVLTMPVRTNEPINISLKNGLRFVNSLCKKPRQPYSSNTAYNVNEVPTIKPQ